VAVSKGEAVIKENPMTGSVDAYIEALLEFERTGRCFTELVNRAARVVEQCRERPERLMFQGTGIGFAWPQGAAAHAVIVQDGEWPEAVKLQQALADWHGARAAAQAAWEALPDRLQRAGLPPPPAPLRSDVLPG